MQRYTPIGQRMVEPSETGLYVRYEDALAAQAADKERIKKLEEALREARGEIISLACTGTERIRDLGGECDDAEKTYWPAVSRLDIALGSGGDEKEKA